MTSAACDAANITPHQALWEYPMAQLGWIIAGSLARKGIKGIGRKTDYGQVFRLLKERARDA